MIKVPPLRERAGDIAELVDYFVAQIAAEQHTSPKRVDAEAMRALSAMPWSGNIRELRNVVERLMILSGERVTAEDVKLYCLKRNCLTRLFWHLACPRNTHLRLVNCVFLGGDHLQNSSCYTISQNKRVLTLLVRHPLFIYKAYCEVAPPYQLSARHLPPRARCVSGNPS